VEGFDPGVVFEGFPVLHGGLDLRKAGEIEVAGEAVPEDGLDFFGLVGIMGRDDEPGHPDTMAGKIAWTSSRFRCPLTAPTDFMARHRYPFETIEPKWQARWDEEKTFATSNPGDPGFDPSKPKYYCLDMFPYPSGSGLHVGHPEGYTATDIICRFKRMKGYNVLHPWVETPSACPRSSMPSRRDSIPGHHGAEHQQLPGPAQAARVFL